MTANPGSKRAMAEGCRCPVMDNGHGQGHGEMTIDGKTQLVFVMNANCPLHGTSVNFDWKEDDERPTV
jgi:hypothetical protein